MCSLSAACFTTSSWQRGRGGWERPVPLIGKVPLRAERPDQPVALIVIGGDIFVRDGPVVAQPVPTLAFEVVRPEAQRNPAPVVGAAPDHAGPPPVELGARG